MVALQMSIDLFVPAADTVFHRGFQPTVITETGGVLVLFNEWTFIGLNFRILVFVIGTQDDICREIPCLPNLQGMRDFIARLAEFLWVEFR